MIIRLNDSRQVDAELLAKALRTSAVQKDDLVDAAAVIEHLSAASKSLEQYRYGLAARLRGNKNLMFAERASTGEVMRYAEMQNSPAAKLHAVTSAYMMFNTVMELLAQSIHPESKEKADD